MRYSIFILLFFWGISVVGSDRGDTLRFMVYNLLYYGINTGFCNSTNNNVDLKDKYLRSVVAYTDPDVLAVNEMGRGAHHATRILEQVMNVVAPDQYSHATYTNTKNTTITNMLFYRHDRLQLYNEEVVSNEVRDINLYTLYYLDEWLEQGDTTFVTCIVAHLKAGSSGSDQQRRLTEISNVMNYIAENDIRGNLMFMGDLNMKSSFEAAYGLLTFHPDETIRFYDPINKPGLWYNNPDFTAYHTQSTRTGSHPCFVTGGMDDRFDQILLSRSLMEGEKGLQYAEGSYVTVGQDGKRLKGSLIYPPNHSAPDSIIHALYHISDHLPVYLELAVNERPTFAYTPESEPAMVIANPVTDILHVSFDQPMNGVHLKLFTLTGRQVLESYVRTVPAWWTIQVDMAHLPIGIYIVRLYDDHRFIRSERVMKVR